jgi:alpha-N-acetylglucosaminidase
LRLRFQEAAFKRLRFQEAAFKRLRFQEAALSRSCAFKKLRFQEMARCYGLLLAATLLIASTAEADLSSVEDLAVRLLGTEHASKFSFKDGEGCTRISSNGTIVEITGANPNDAAHGLGVFLRTECLMSFAWSKTGGHQLHMPAELPVADLEVCRRVPYTYYQNVVTASYSMWNWDWERWEREIDWMALMGINLALAFTGQEEVYRKVFLQLGMNDTQLEGFFDGPAYLAWSRGQGMSGVGGPVPIKFLKQQWKLQQQIVQRQTELGVGSILPQFQGNVPKPFVELFPTANISVQTGANSGWLDGLDPLFEKVSGMVLSTLIKDFGMTGYYEADGFFNHDTGPWMDAQSQRQVQRRDTRKQSAMPESVPPVLPSLTGTPADAKARTEKVFAIMKEQDPDAVWVYQGWIWLDLAKQDQGKDYIRGFTSGVPSGRYTFSDTYSSHASLLFRSHAPLLSTRVPRFPAARSLFTTLPRPLALLSFDRLLILDMEAEEEEIWQLTDSFYNASFVWAAMNNFGGNNGLYGDMPLVYSRTEAVLPPLTSPPSSPSSSSSSSSSSSPSASSANSCAGLGITMEGAVLAVHRLL